MCGKLGWAGHGKVSRCFSHSVRWKLRITDVKILPFLWTTFTACVQECVSFFFLCVCFLLIYLCFLIPIYYYFNCLESRDGNLSSHNNILNFLFYGTHLYVKFLAVILYRGPNYQACHCFFYALKDKSLMRSSTSTYTLFVPVWVTYTIY